MINEFREGMYATFEIKESTRQTALDAAEEATADLLRKHGG